MFELIFQTYCFCITLLFFYKFLLSERLSTFQNSKYGIQFIALQNYLLITHRKNRITAVMTLLNSLYCYTFDSTFSDVLPAFTCASVVGNL